MVEHHRCRSARLQLVGAFLDPEIAVISCARERVPAKGGANGVQIHAGAEQRGLPAKTDRLKVEQVEQSRQATAQCLAGLLEHLPRNPVTTLDERGRCLHVPDIRAALPPQGLHYRLTAGDSLQAATIPTLARLAFPFQGDVPELTSQPTRSPLEFVVDEQATADPAADLHHCKSLVVPTATEPLLRASKRVDIVLQNHQRQARGASQLLGKGDCLAPAKVGREANLARPAVNMAPDGHAQPDSPLPKFGTDRQQFGHQRGHAGDDPVHSGPVQRMAPQDLAGRPRVRCPDLEVDDVTVQVDEQADELVCGDPNTNRVLALSRGVRPGRPIVAVANPSRLPAEAYLTCLLSYDPRTPPVNARARTEQACHAPPSWSNRSWPGHVVAMPVGRALRDLRWPLLLSRATVFATDGRLGVQSR